MSPPLSTATARAPSAPWPNPKKICYNKHMNYILASWRLDPGFTEYVQKWSGKNLSELSVAIIPAAKQHHPSEYVEFKISQYTEILKDFGFGSAFFLDIQNRSQKEIESSIQKADVVLVLGGNSFFLLDVARKCNLATILSKQPDSKTYIGISAGSIVVGPSIEIADNDFANDPDIVGLKNLTGLGLLDFAIFPHYKDEYDEKMNELISEKNIQYPIYALRDEQNLIVSGDDISFLGGAPTKFN